MKKFALIGVGGYIAPRHLEAIKATGNELVAAVDKSDSVGIIDSYFPDADFFTEFERFDRHLEKLHRKGERVDYVSICSPNYLHDAHVRFALRIGADAICEKPLVINPWNVEALQEISNETGGKINTIMQLRLHKSVQELKKEIENSPKDKKHELDLTYVTSRGHWYMASWKGDEKKSGGIATNIGVHFFDMLTWIFGPVQKNIVHLYQPKRAAGVLELENARVRWFLSLCKEDLPNDRPDGAMTHRSIVYDDKEFEFSHGFSGLHTKSYEHILAGDGFGLKDILPSIEIVSDIRRSKPLGLKGQYHPMLDKLKIKD